MHTNESARGKGSGALQAGADGLNSAAGLPRSPLVVLIDPARLTRESLGHLLHEKAPDFRIETLPDCSETMAHQPEVPAIVLVNAKMAEIADPGLKSAAVRLTEIWPDVPRLLISDRADEPVAALAAIQDGWRGFFPATLEVDLLVAAVRLVISRGIFLPPEVAQHCAALLSSSEFWPHQPTLYTKSL
jgi:DNA-binding NarL/FixJ family response regulator